MGGDVGHSVTYREDLVGLGVGDFDAELLLDGHDHLDGVQRVQVQVLLEAGGRGDSLGHLQKARAKNGERQEDKSNIGEDTGLFAQQRNTICKYGATEDRKRQIEMTHLLVVLDNVHHSVSDHLGVKEGLRWYQTHMVIQTDTQLGESAFTCYTNIITTKHKAYLSLLSGLRKASNGERGGVNPDRLHGGPNGGSLDASLGNSGKDSLHCGIL